MPRLSASVRTITSFVFVEERKASACISRLRVSGMRRRTTGVAPGRPLRRPVGA
jgi:hypothetical protein